MFFVVHDISSRDDSLVMEGVAQEQDERQGDNQNSNVAIPTEPTVQDEHEPSQQEGESEFMEKIEVMSPPLELEPYTRQAHDQAIADGKKILLTFFADWCPTCRNEIKKELTPALAEIMSNEVVVFHVNIEDRNTDADEEALQKEFQVLGRHVKLFLNPDGSVYKKTAPENWKTDRYISEITDFINS